MNKIPKITFCQQNFSKDYFQTGKLEVIYVKNRNPQLSVAKSNQAQLVDLWNKYDIMVIKNHVSRKIERENMYENIEGGFL